MASCGSGTLWVAGPQAPCLPVVNTVPRAQMVRRRTLAATSQLCLQARRPLRQRDLLLPHITLLCRLTPLAHGGISTSPVEDGTQMVVARARRCLTPQRSTFRMGRRCCSE